MGKLAVLVMQSHGALTCEYDCVAKNTCLPLPGEIKPPQTTQNCRNDGKSSAAISGTDLTLRVMYFPRQPRTPVLPRRPPDSRSTSYPAGTTCWHLQMPVCHHRMTKKFQRRGAAHATLLHLVFLSKGAAASATLLRLLRQAFCVRGARGDQKRGFYSILFILLFLFLSLRTLPLLHTLYPPFLFNRLFKTSTVDGFNGGG